MFQDRIDAGQKLARKLKSYANRQDLLVLGLPRGGIPVAFEVANGLNAPLDVLLVRKLGVPGREECAMGAIASPGIQILNGEIIKRRRISKAVIANVASREQQELERRQAAYRKDCTFIDVRDRTVILVDDGMATGATMQAAILAVRQQHPKQIIIAVPVATLEIYNKLQTKVDKIICVKVPEKFNSVSFWYHNFSQTTDAEVRDLLYRAAEKSRRSDRNSRRGKI